MARSSLFRTLITLARAHARAQAATDSDERARQARRAAARQRSALSRRSFLGAVGATAAAMLLPRSAEAATTPRIAIVGAGISGLAAALALSDAKLAGALTVYEASNRIGGRMFSNTPKIGGMSYWDEDQVTEWCGELIDTDHTTVQDLAARFGLPLDDLLVEMPMGAAAVHVFDGTYYPPDQLAADFAPVWDAVAADSDAAIPVNKADGSPNEDETVLWDALTPEAITLDNLSVYDWIEAKVPGGHTAPLGKLLDAAYASEYGADTKNQSSLNLVLLLSGLVDPLVFAAFGGSDERYHIRGGNQQLPLAIADELTTTLGAGAIQMNSRLTKLVKNADGTSALTFSVLKAGATSDVVVTADAVILALPFAVLADKVDFSAAGFDERKTRAIKELGRGLCSKLQVQFTSRHWKTAGPWGVDNGEESFSDNGDQCSWEVTRAQPGTAGIMNGYSGGQLTLDRAKAAPVSFGKGSVGSNGAAIDALAAGLVDQLDQLFPGIKPLDNGKTTLSIPHLDENMRLSYAYWGVGQYQAFAGYERVPQGTIFFAGEHTSVNYQGFMEGGASEGVRAAGEVVAAAAAGKLPSAPTTSPPVDDGGCAFTPARREGASVLPVAAAVAGLALLGRRTTGT